MLSNTTRRIALSETFRVISIEGQNRLPIGQTLCIRTTQTERVKEKYWKKQAFAKEHLHRDVNFWKLLVWRD